MTSDEAVEAAADAGKIGTWEMFKHILRVQFTHPPHPPIKRKASHESQH